MIKKINWPYISLSAAGIGIALLFGYSSVITTQHIARIDQDTLNTQKHDLQQQHENEITAAKIELATNPRMANIMAYMMKSNAPDDFVWGNGLIHLSDELKTDYIDDNVFARLKAAGAYSAEFYDISNNVKLIRKKWFIRVQNGSHFDKSPSGSLMIPGESIGIPRCSEGQQPYVAYALAAPTKNNIDLDITAAAEDHQYRFSLPQLSWDDALNYRILVDVGCTVVPEPSTDEKTEEAKAK